MVEYLCLINIVKQIPSRIIDEYACGKRNTYNFGNVHKNFDIWKLNSRIIELQSELLEPYAIKSDSKE